MSQFFSFSKRVITGSVVTFLASGGAYLGLTFHLTRQLDKGSIAINLSGRQRTLTQRMTKAASILHHHQQTASNALPQESDYYWKQFTESYDLFDSTLKAFESGGEVIGSDGKPVYLEPLSGENIRQQVEDLAWQNWQEVATTIQPSLGQPEAISEERYAILLEENVAILTAMNQLTSDLQVKDQRLAQQLQWIQFLAFLLSLLFFLYLISIIQARYHPLKLIKQQY